MTARKQDNPVDATDIDLAVSLGDPVGVSDCPDIWMDPEVMKRIETFAATDMTKELAGVLLGELVTKDRTPLVRVTAAIEAKHTEAVHTSVKFTHATWDDINRVKDEKYPGMKIVGWFHTHPGFGVFLSRWDMFIQDNFFNLPWQIAYVVDPINKTNGFFRWENGKIAQVGRDRPEPVDVVLPPVESCSSKFPWALAASGLLCVGLGVALVYTLFFRPPQVKVVVRERVVLPVGHIAPLAGVATASVAFWDDYTVERGDSLWAIAESKYGDGTYLNAICVLNDVTEQDKLPVGKRLQLPCKKLADRLHAGSGYAERR